MSCRGERGVGGYLRRMKKDGEKSSSFFVVLFGNLVKNDILREYRQPQASTIACLHSLSVRVENKFANVNFYSYICINKNGSTYD